MTRSPAQLHVAAIVRAQIADGTLKPGDIAPSCAALSRATGHAKPTCRKALQLLVKEGALAMRHSATGRPRVAGEVPDSQDASRSAAVLSGALARRRRAAGLIQPELAALIGTSLTSVGHAETRRLWQSRDFWERADKALGADGELLDLHTAYIAAGPDDPELQGLLTDAEREAVRQAGLLYTLIAERVIADGDTREDDLAELRATVHHIQRMVLSQAAARAYPAEFRLLGKTIPGSGPVGGKDRHGLPAGAAIRDARGQLPEAAVRVEPAPARPRPRHPGSELQGQDARTRNSRQAKPANPGSEAVAAGVLLGRRSPRPMPAGSSRKNSPELR